MWSTCPVSVVRLGICRSAAERRTVSCPVTGTSAEENPPPTNGNWNPHLSGLGRCGWKYRPNTGHRTLRTTAVAGNSRGTTVAVSGGADRATTRRPTTCGTGLWTTETVYHFGDTIENESGISSVYRVRRSVREARQGTGPHPPAVDYLRSRSTRLSRRRGDRHLPRRQYGGPTDRKRDDGRFRSSAFRPRRR